MAPGSPIPCSFTVEDFHRSRRFVDTEFGRIAYVEHGTGPAALFLHGALLCGYQWRHQLAGLSDIRRVIAIDAMGMGYTEVLPRQPLGMRHQAEMIAAFLGALGIDRVDLVGNDSGGGAAQAFAALRPEAVRSMTLTNCEVHDFEPISPAFVRFRKLVQTGSLVDAVRQAAESPEFARTMLAAAYEDVTRIPHDAIAAAFAPLVQSPARIEQMLGYFLSLSNADLVVVAAKLRTLQAPSLVLWGKADGFFPVAQARWLGNNLAKVVEVVEIDGAPLFWLEERPAFLNQKLRALWARVP